MITKKRMKEALDLAVFRGATYISEDVYEALQAAIDREDGPAKEGLRRTLQSLELSVDCGDSRLVEAGTDPALSRLISEALFELSGKRCPPKRAYASTVKKERRHRR